MPPSGSGQTVRRVVVTGFGPVTPITTGVEEFWSALLAGRSGIDRIRSFDASDMPVKIAGEVKDFRPEDWLTPKEVKRTDRAVHLALTVAGFAQMQALTKNREPSKASRPFDKHRDGFVLSEGAGALVLEEAERARGRGARIYAEVAGYGASADAYHITAPEPEGLGAIQAIQAALEEAGEPPDAVGYINAHGTSTQLNDVAETRAIK